MAELPKFSRHLGNRGRGTRWCRQIFHRKWKYGRFEHASGHNYWNSSFIMDVDVAMGQIPRSTERISSFYIVICRRLLGFTLDVHETLLALTLHVYSLRI